MAQPIELASIGDTYLLGLPNGVPDDHAARTRSWMQAAHPKQHIDLLQDERAGTTVFAVTPPVDGPAHAYIRGLAIEAAATLTELGSPTELYDRTVIPLGDACLTAVMIVCAKR